MCRVMLGTLLLCRMPACSLLRTQSASLETRLFLQAFAQFANPLSAQAAKDAIHGRLFAGSTVEVHYITAQQFGAVGGFQ